MTALAASALVEAPGNGVRANTSHSTTSAATATETMYARTVDAVSVIVGALRIVVTFVMIVMIVAIVAIVAVVVVGTNGGRLCGSR